MLEKGYPPDHVLMCGDAPGDLSAAEKNGVFYYPILVGREAESWADFPGAVNVWEAGEYAPLGERLAKEFVRNLVRE